MGSLDFTETEMTVIELKDVVSDPNGSLDCLLTGLTSHIDALADDNHYFVINTEGTSIVDHYKNHTEVHTHVRTYVCTHVRTYVRTHVRTYVRTYVHMYIHTYVHTYICMYVRTYLHAAMQLIFTH